MKGSASTRVLALSSEAAGRTTGGAAKGLVIGLESCERLPAPFSCPTSGPRSTGLGDPGQKGAQLGNALAAVAAGQEHMREGGGVALQLGLDLRDPALALALADLVDLGQHHLGGDGGVVEHLQDLDIRVLDAM